MTDYNEKFKCVMKGCNNDRYKGREMCEKHWKNRRKTKRYKYNEC